MNVKPAKFLKHIRKGVVHVLLRSVTFASSMMLTIKGRKTPDLNTGGK